MNDSQIDWHVFMWQPLEILNVFNTLTMRQTKKNENLFQLKILVESTKTENATSLYKTALPEANFKKNRKGSTKWN